MADLTNRHHHHHARAASAEELERKMGERYPEAVAVLERQEESWRQGLSRSESVQSSAPHPRGSEVRTSENLNLLGGRVDKGLLSSRCSGRSGC